MLDKDIITASGKAEFDKYVKEYYVNMTGNVRTLHKKGCYLCPLAYSFITFDSKGEVDAYEKMHQNATPFKKCGVCFKNKGQ